MNTQTPQVRVIIPTPTRMQLVYRTATGEIKTYEISPPIEKKADSFVAYSFAKQNKSGGIRSFKFAGVISLN
jgi:hypothetical protein